MFPIKENLKDALLYPFRPSPWKWMLLSLLALCFVLLAFYAPLSGRLLHTLIGVYVLYMLLYFRSISFESWDRNPNMPPLWKIKIMDRFCVAYIILFMYVVWIIFSMLGVEGYSGLALIGIVFIFPMIAYTLVSAESIVDMSPFLVYRSIMRNKTAYLALWGVLLSMLVPLYAIFLVVSEILHKEGLYTTYGTVIFFLISGCIYAALFSMRYLSLLHRDGA